MRFCLLHLPPTEAVRGSILYLHPFAEEMNRSRLVAARAARSFAAEGYAVLQIDLYGCGDSAGDFGDASWVQWLNDAQAGLAYLEERFDAPSCIWGLRCGALLAGITAALRPRSAAPALLLWQPVLSGKQHLQQFLRLSLAADMLDGKTQEGKESARLHDRLAAGESVEVAGYTLAPVLAQGLAEAELPQLERTHCIEIQPSAGALTPALRRYVEAGNIAANVCVDAQCWIAPGVMSSPALQAASLDALRSLLP